MKNLSPAYLAHVRSPVTTLAICWRIVKRNGELIMGTNHDRNIVVTETNIGVEVSASSGFDLVGTYAATSGITASDIKSSSDMSVDNMEVQGAVKQPDMAYDDIDVTDIEAGLLDAAQVTTFRLNWQNPDDFQEVLRHGTLGELSRTAEGRYIEEALGLTQVLQQMIGRTCGDRCDVAEFGDIRCQFPVESLRVTGVVTEVTNRREFKVEIDTDSGGDIGDVLLWDVMPHDIQVGDEFSGIPACDRRYETCRDIYGNLLNFRGPGIFTPGMDQIIRAPGSDHGPKTPEEYLAAKHGGGGEETTNKKEFIQAIRDAQEGGDPPPPIPPHFFERYDGGRLEFTTGPNVGFVRELKHLIFTDES